MDNPGRAPTSDGPTHHRVADNVRALRQRRGLSQAEVSRHLAELGTPLGVSALSKIEKGTRRVTVDELVALAITLDVSPNRLLLPGDVEPAALAEHLEIDQEPIALTPAFTVSPTTAWAWAAGDEPLPAHPDLEGHFDPVSALPFIRENQPHRMPDPALEDQVRRLVQDSRDRSRASRHTPTEGE